MTPVTRSTRNKVTFTNMYHFCVTNDVQNPGIVDEGLAENILRDSCDPGAVGVIAAGGKLPFSRSANEMLGKFGVRHEELSVTL